MVDRRLLYIVSTARYGSFTAAAERVGVTQSAITKSVAELERELGYSIFNRTARGVFLTDEGRTFVERAARILEDTRELFRGMSPGSDPYEGTLRIGVCPASLEWLLGKLPRAGITREVLTPEDLHGRADHFGWMKAPEPVAARIAQWLDNMD